MDLETFYLGICTATLPQHSQHEVMCVPKISIIVPVYKAEKHLNHCLDSILVQTFKDFELILVDDGSPDNSGAICDEYAGKDTRVKVIHKENGGVSSARNTALASAQGEYVVFCDADDQLTQNALLHMIDASNRAGSQMIIGGFEYIHIDATDNIMHSKKDLTRTNTKITLNGTLEMLAFWKNNNMISACAKLFQRDIISDNQIVFNTNQVVLEDYGFVIDYLAHCHEICMIEDVVYQCFSHSDSPFTTRRARLDFYDDVILVANKLTGYLAEIGCTCIESFLELKIYSTLQLSFDLLWDIPYHSFSEKIFKYRRIRAALSETHFQKLAQKRKDSNSICEFFCLKHKMVYSILCLRKLRYFLSKII